MKNTIPFDFDLYQSGNYRCMNGYGHRVVPRLITAQIALAQGVKYYYINPTTNRESWVCENGQMFVGVPTKFDLYLVKI
jgi:hypothetical protein